MTCTGVQTTMTERIRRFTISKHENGYYQVSIPNYEGGEVVDAGLWDEMAEALSDVPDPSDEGFCSSCHTYEQLPLERDTVTFENGKSYDRSYFKHDSTCWYGKVFALLNRARQMEASK